ncbi:YqzL family protein [Sporolactobacillus sp. KGMB 08714]
MLDLAWWTFCMTGSIDVYLLMREIEQDREGQSAAEPLSGLSEPAG